MIVKALNRQAPRIGRDNGVAPYGALTRKVEIDARCSICRDNHVPSVRPLFLHRHIPGRSHSIRRDDG